MGRIYNVLKGPWEPRESPLAGIISYCLTFYRQSCTDAAGLSKDDNASSMHSKEETSKKERCYK